MNKGITKRILASHGIRTPRCFHRWQNEVEQAGLPDGFDYPVVVKPPNQGSTIGVSIVRESKELLPAQVLAFCYSPEILVEEFIEGLEITVGVLGESALPVIEILPQAGFYTYEAKYQKGKTEYILPARLEASVYREVQEMAVAACRAVGCEGIARVDFRVDPKGVSFVLEINTIPGMTETSLYPKAAAQAGIDYDTLVERILESALRREKAWG
jgi:D-alanine-D-alanine ligase